VCTPYPSHFCFVNIGSFSNIQQVLQRPHNPHLPDFDEFCFINVHDDLPAEGEREEGRRVAAEGDHTTGVYRGDEVAGEGDGG